MKVWMLPWLLPLWMLAAVVAVSVSDLAAVALAVLSGYIVFPYVAAYIRSHAQPPGGAGRELDDGYWQIKHWL